MSKTTSNTPVIVGVGFCQVKSDDPLDCPEASQMMVTAIRNAADDAGSQTLLPQIESIGVQKGSWSYPNPGKLLADELGCPTAKSILADLGVLQIMPFLELCQSIAKGEQQVGVVTGGESRYRDLRSMITGQPVSNTEQAEDTPPPDVFYETPDAFCCDLEAERGVWSPGEFYAIADSAVRYHQGISIEEHRKKIGQLYANFSKIAEKNPHAWIKQPLNAEEISTPSDKNAMIAFPYTKRLVSQWNVNQAVAIMVCSETKAREMGLDDTNWIYPLSAAQSRHVVNLAQKKELHSHPGTVLTGKRTLELAKVTTDDITVAELYSCFPSAIQSSAKDLQLEGKCPLSVTGSMAYAGGPFNHGALDSVARMVEVLRENKNNNANEHSMGLVTSLSGMFGKQGCTLLSSHASNDGFLFDDVTKEVAELEEAIPIDASYVGPAKIVAYSVMYNKGEISHGIAYCDTPSGKRTIVRTNDAAMADQMTKEEFVGKTIDVQSGGNFLL